MSLSLPCLTNDTEGTTKYPGNPSAQQFSWGLCSLTQGDPTKKCQPGSGRVSDLLLHCPTMTKEVTAEATTVRNGERPVNWRGKNRSEAMTRDHTAHATVSSSAHFQCCLHPAILETSIPSTLGIVFSFGPCVLYEK